MFSIQVKGLKNFQIDKNQLVKLKNKSSLEVGFYDSVVYPNGAKLPNVAQWLEYGTINILPRPFFRNAVEANNNKWLDYFKNADTQNENQLYARLGEMVRGDIVKSITILRNPPNMPSTIKAKGSSNPLIDTGLMRRSVTYKVNQ